MKYLKNIDKQRFTEIVNESNSKSDIGRKLGFGFYNGTLGREINHLLNEYKISTSHFQRGKEQIKYKIIEKICPVCNKKFETKEGHKREQVTCSCACSNTYFRSGKDNGQFKGGNQGYQNICFIEHGKKCIICGESKIVAAHHFDENHSNDDPKNIIPLCPTHHCYMHSRFKKEIISKIEDYLKEKYK